MAKQQFFGNGLNLIIIIVVIGFLFYVVCGMNSNNASPIQNSGNYNDIDVNDDEDVQLGNEHLSGTLQDSNSIDFTAGSTNNVEKSYIDATAVAGNLNSYPGNKDVLGDNIMGLKSADSGLEKLRKASCFPKDQLTPAELLPQDNSSTWAQVHPQGEGTLKDKNFLQAGHHIGINTVGQTLRNANMQLRSEPPNPQVQISPWMQSTINPDMNRKPMEIGGCA